MVKSPNYFFFISSHFRELKAEDRFLDPARSVRSVPSPDFAFHVVLKEHRRNGELFGKVHRCVEEVADRNIKPLLCIPILQLRLDAAGGKAADGVGSGVREARHIIQSAPQLGITPSAAAQTNRPRKMLPQRLLISRIRLAVVVGKKRELMPRRELPSNVVRTNIAAAMYGQNLVRFCPEYLQELFLDSGRGHPDGEDFAGGAIRSLRFIIKFEVFRWFPSSDSTLFSVRSRN